MCELIELYRSFPCLWQIKSKDYLNRNKKDLAFTAIVEKLRESDPESDITKEKVIQKISGLRSTYKREKAKVDASIRSGAGAEEIYIPKLWYYHQLGSFLKDQYQPGPSISNIDDSENEVRNKNSICYYIYLL